MALVRLSQDQSDDNWTFIKLMAWCYQATCHYVDPCWFKSIPPYGTSRPRWYYTMCFERINYEILLINLSLSVWWSIFQFILTIFTLFIATQHCKQQERSLIKIMHFHSHTLIYFFNPIRVRRFAVRSSPLPGKFLRLGCRCVNGRLSGGYAYPNYITTWPSIDCGCRMIL